MRWARVFRKRSQRRSWHHRVACERLEQRIALAVTASLVDGELQIGFTSSSLPEQVARISTDGLNYVVRNTNNISIGTFPAPSVSTIRVNGIAGRERLEFPASSPQPVAASLVVAASVESTVIAKAINASGGVRIASPEIQLSAAVSSTADLVFGGTVEVGGAVSATGASVRFESVVSGSSGSRLTIDAADISSILGGLAGGIRLVKQGAGRLDIESKSTHSGGTLVENGEIRAGRTEALGSTVEVAGGGRVSLASDKGSVELSDLDLAATGRLDVGDGGIRVAPEGYDPATLRNWLMSGRAGGGWNGPAGISSSAATDSAGTRSVGMIIESDGSALVAFAAPGDVDLNGMVDVFDLVTIGGSGTYGTGGQATWGQGDANYDGIVNVFDLVSTVSSATFGTGTYLPDRGPPSFFAEDWEGSSTTRLGSGAWRLQTGDWGRIEQQDVRGAGRKLAINPGDTSSLMRPIDVTDSDHVVLQGWLSDSAGINRSTLGLASFPTVADAALIRVGATGKPTYRVEYFDASSGGLVEVDTGVVAEPGWHLFRLDLVRRRTDPSIWDVTWRGWNAAQTVEQMGSFAWRFDPSLVNWATLGASGPSTGGMAWDQIAVGPVTKIGPPIALPPRTVQVTASASSAIPGWEPWKLVDNDDNSVYSSTGHLSGATTEWAAIDLGGPFTINALSITPRAGGLGFPVDYQIQFSTDMLAWTTVPGQVYAGRDRPDEIVTHTFATPLEARGLRVFATQLGTDGVDNSSGGHYLQLARLEVPHFKLDTESWVKPAELRGKSINSTGVFSNTHFESSVAPTPKFLAEHPEYLANHPFDGVTIPLMIDLDYTRSQGLVTTGPHAMQWIGMSSLPIPWSAVAESVEYLKQVQWGHVTDNFLWYGVQNLTNSSWEDGDRGWFVDPDSQADWDVVVANAAVAARAARESGLKGFLVDTEQYTKYPTGDRPEYPFGLGDASTWRERGRQWIEAVQSEFPAIELQFFFSWGDEYLVWPHYENLVPFMDGVLAGIQDPGRIVHAFESSFWWGQARSIPPGSGSFTLYDADRSPYIAARDSIRNLWRNVSDDPSKYDDYVDVGMAAWFESDPWNLWPGWPSGYLGDTVNWGRSAWPGMPWSNVANTLAYSDKYVWTWSGNTHYAATADQLNPFLASIANQTFNTGRERVAAFSQDFSSDPMQDGWYFNFSFMDIGRRESPNDGPPQLVQTTDAVAYAWSEADGAVHVRGSWTRGEFGEIEGLAAPQQRRYVRPIEPLTRRDDVFFEARFTVDSFGTDASNPILLGLFHSEAAVDRQAFTLQIAGPSDLSLVVAGDGPSWTLPIMTTAPLALDQGYEATVEYVAATRGVVVRITDRTSGIAIATAAATLPENVGPFVLDESGLAQREEAFATKSADAYRFRLEGFRFGGPTAAMAPQNAIAIQTNPTLSPAIHANDIWLMYLEFTATITADEEGAVKRRTGAFD
jgi:autotransporter-associated beta strand protein